MDLETLRKSAIDIYQHGLRAVDAREATRKIVVSNSDIARVFDLTAQPIYVIAIGKAALSMALGINDVLGEKITGAVISTAPSAPTLPLPQTHNVFHGGHPLPNQQSLDAADAAFDLLDRAEKESALVIFLVSGGGSAMLERPISKDITLEELQDANRQLITSGATITEINAVRRAMSAIKGGGLVERARSAQFITLIVSDTNPGDESSVASGPTLGPPADAPSAPRVIEEYGLIASLPSSIVTAVRKYKREIRSGSESFYVLLDNAVAVNAAARTATELGFSTTIAFDINEQTVDEGSNLLLDRASATETFPSCLISGGEFSCRIGGSGRGGRNLETVLRCAVKLHHGDRLNHTVVLSAGTDGIDGSSFAAGATADETTVSRALELGLDPADYLERSDSHAFFEALGDLIVTEPTGTNVRDLRIVLRG